MKIIRVVILILAGAVFATTVFFTDHQIVQFRFFPGQEAVPLSFEVIAFFYVSLGLVTAIILGLLDRVSLVLMIKKIEKEKKALLSHTSQLKDIMAEERRTEEV